MRARFTFGLVTLAAFPACGDGANGVVFREPAPHVLPQSGVFRGVVPHPHLEPHPGLVTLVVGFHRDGGRDANVVVQFGTGEPVALEGTVADGTTIQLPPFEIRNYRGAHPSYAYSGRFEELVLSGAAEGLAIRPNGSFSAFELDVDTFATFEEPFVAAAVPRAELLSPGQPIEPVSGYPIVAGEPLQPTEAWFEIAGLRIDGRVESSGPWESQLRITPARPLPWGEHAIVHVAYVRGSGEPGTATFEAAVLGRSSEAPFDPQLGSLDGLATVGLELLPNEQFPEATGLVAPDAWLLAFEVEVPDTPGAALRARIVGEGTVELRALGADGGVAHASYDLPHEPVVLDLAELRGQRAIVELRGEPPPWGGDSGPDPAPEPEHPTFVESVEVLP